MTLSDILGSVLGGSGNAPPSSMPTTPAERAAYQKYSLACQEQGMQPKPYPAWVQAGRPPT